MPRPRLFLSAVSQEWRSLRQRVARLLASQGYDCVSQDDFATGHGELRQWLRKQIDGCEGLIQLVGEAYGAEPPEPDPTWGRVSYTQYEFLYARDQGKKTWVLAPGGDCVRDTARDRLDQPDPAHALEPTATVAWQAERRSLQQAYRARLVASNHLRHEPQSEDQVKITILELRDELRELRRQEDEWRRADQDYKARSLARLETIAEASRLTSEKINAHLLATNEDTHRRELAEADTPADWQERQRRREAAEAAHAARLQRIEEVAAAFADIEGRGGGTGVFQEMRRILAEQGVDEAIAFVTAQRPSLLEAARRRTAAAQARNRQELAPLLQAAALHETKGQAEAARALYTELVDIEPTWAEVLHQGFRFLVGQGDRSMVYASLGVALEDYRQAEQWVGRLIALDTLNAEWRRDMSLSLNKIGNVLVAQGCGVEALAAYRKSLAIREALVASDPANTEWQRDLSVSHIKIGDVLWDQVGAVGALAAYRTGLVLAEALVARDPAHIEWQRDRAVIHDRIGDVLKAQGDWTGALVAYRKGQDTAEALAARDPAHTEWQRDLSVSHSKIGGVLESQHDGLGALAAYGAARVIIEALVVRDPANTEWQRDLSVNHNNVGNVLLAQGDCVGALSAYRNGLSIRQGLVALDPANTVWLRDLSVSYNKIGNALLVQESFAEALAAYREDLSIAESLVARDPAHIQWRADLAETYGNLSKVSLLPVAERRALLQRGLRILKDLKSAGRLHPNQDWVEEFKRRLAQLPPA